MRTLYEITLRGMRFHPLVGVLPHEREHPQPLEVDLTAWLVPDQPIVDYRRLYAYVRSSLESASLEYLEEIADAIATEVMHESSVQRVRIAVRKPHVSVGGPLDHAEVAIERARDA